MHNQNNGNEEQNVFCYRMTLASDGLWQVTQSPEKESNFNGNWQKYFEQEFTTVHDDESLSCSKT